jgi:error-prone DNA polymerase
VRFDRAPTKILCQGRGSAAKSAVCFVLGVTSIDPVRHGLLFERFDEREKARCRIDHDLAADRKLEDDLISASSVRAA